MSLGSCNASPPGSDRDRPCHGYVIRPAKTEALIEKIQSLPPDRLAEVEDFVDFLRQRDQVRALTRDAVSASAPAFAAIWNNVEDNIYDAL
jgi:hypothetical protein